MNAIFEPARATRGAASTVQLWIEALSDDPEAISALAVARETLAAGKALRVLRRVRLIELTGVLPPEAELADWLHRSTRFYNPHKERCRPRRGVEVPPPLAADERAVLVFDRGGERRTAAERWWRHATGRAATVREGVAWVVAAEPGTDPEVLLGELAVLRDRRHGLLCNPHAQEWRPGSPGVPLPWFRARAPRGDRGTRRRT
jgi:hypothetical protein